MGISKTQSIRDRLVNLLLASCVLVMAVASVAFVMHEQSMNRKDLVHDVSLVAELIEADCKAPLNSGDPAAGAEVLKRLKSYPEVRSAALVGREGQTIGIYQRDQTAQSLKPGLTTGGEHWFVGNLLEFVRPVGTSGGELGRIHIWSDLRASLDHWTSYGYLTLAVLCSCGCGAFIISGRLHPATKRAAELQAEVARRTLLHEDVTKSERFLQSTLDALSAHVAILDEEGKIVAVNAAWNQFARANHHSSPERQLGSNYIGICEAASGERSEGADVVAAGIRSVITKEKEEFHIEYPCHAPNEQRWFMLRVTRFGDQGCSRVVISHENITERKLAEQSLQNTLRSLADIKSVLDREYIIAVTDPTGAITHINDKFCAISGYSREELLGKNHRILKSDHHPKNFFRELWRTISSGNVWRGDIQNRAKDGHSYWVDSAIGPMLDERGRPKGYLAIRTDITARKRMEAEAAEMNKMLIESSRVAGMAEVATGVLHNVGNVLNSVNISCTVIGDRLRKSKVSSLGRVNGLLREHAATLGDYLTKDQQGRQVPGFLEVLAAQLESEQQCMLGELQQLGRNMEHIKDIITMQQSLAKVGGLTETVSVPELVEDALRLNSSSLTRHSIQLVKEVEAELPLIEIDRHKTLQILVNLVQNARDACDSSGRSDKRITLRASAAGPHIRVQVCDNGMGIAADHLDRIFNHGFTTKKDGHGFGLHSGANAAREMGGNLSVTSDGPGHGAVFTLELPVEFVRRENSPAKPAPSTTASAPLYP